MSCHTHRPVFMPRPSCPGSCSGECHPAWKPLGGKESIPGQEDRQKLVPGGAGLSIALGNPQWLPFPQRGRHGQALKSGDDEEVGGQRLMVTSPSADELVPPSCLEARHSRGDLPERAGVFQVP